MNTLTKALQLQQYDVETLYDRFYGAAIDDFAGSAVGYYLPTDSDEEQANKDRRMFRMIAEEMISEIFDLDENSRMSVYLSDFVDRYYPYVSY